MSLKLLASRTRAGITIQGLLDQGKNKSSQMRPLTAVSSMPKAKDGGDTKLSQMTQPVNARVLNHTVDHVNSDLGLPRLVVLGSGWGSISLVENLKACLYNFLFTPLLPEAASGTLEPYSVMEGSRKICSNNGTYFVEANVKGIDFENKVINAVSITGEQIKVPYDVAVISLGAIVNTFGIPGVEEHATTLNTVENARFIRKKVISNFEKAELTEDPNERKRLLSFVVCGAGPTGVECIAELNDLIKNDLIAYYPKLVKEDVRLILVEGADRILLSFSPQSSQKVQDHIESLGIETQLRSFVTKVDEKSIHVGVVDPETNEKTPLQIPCGLCVWSGGVGLNPIVKEICEKLTPGKRARGIIIDEKLIAENTRDVYAIGDCSTFKDKSLEDIFLRVLGDSANAELPYSEFLSTFKKVQKELPYKHIPDSKFYEHFNQFDANKNGTLDRGELKILCNALNMKYTKLAPTAQVATQQAKYLANILNNATSSKVREKWIVDTSKAAPFKYDHKGSFSYVGGGKSILEFNSGRVLFGRLAFLTWKSYYLQTQKSMKNKIIVLFTWLRRYALVFFEFVFNSCLFCKYKVPLSEGLTAIQEYVHILNVPLTKNILCVTSKFFKQLKSTSKGFSTLVIYVVLRAGERSTSCTSPK